MSMTLGSRAPLTVGSGCSGSAPAWQQRSPLKLVEPSASELQQVRALPQLCLLGLVPVPLSSGLVQLGVCT